MAASTKLLQRRIKSIQNTKKITKAMELVSASKMRKAVNSVVSTRPYADLAWMMVQEISKKLDLSAHPLLRKTEKMNSILLVLLASDRGLAGPYNAQIIKILNEALKSSQFPLAKADQLEFVTIGKKGESFIKKLGFKIIASFSGFANNPKSVNARAIAGLATGDFMSQKYDRVYLLYTDYYSALKQVPRIKQLLPIEKDEELGATIQSLRGSASWRRQSNLPDGIATRPSVARNDTRVDEYLFEPNPKQVLDLMLPRIVETQVLQALLEASASEHSARMVAMKNATDSAADLIDDLVFTYNQIRQGTITRELAEIAAARAAIE